jgi:hypothetical protein
MNENQPTDLKRASDWLAGEVEIKVSRKLLVGSAVLAFFLIMIAFD